MPSPQARINRSFDLLIQGAAPFVERELQGCYRDNWQEAARSSFREDRGIAINKGETIRWDTHSLLTVMWDQWNGVFRHKLGFLERSLVSELREYRNRWAHQTQTARINARKNAPTSPTPHDHCAIPSRWCHATADTPPPA